MMRKTVIFTISLLLIAVVTLGVFAYGSYKRAEILENTAAMNYQHAFSELRTGLSEMDTALQKSIYVRGAEAESAVCAEIFSKAMTAQMALGVLPFSTQELEQTAGFISRVGDYAFAMTRQAANGGLTDEQRESLRSLSDTATLLSQNVSQMQADMSDGLLTMDELLQSEARLDELEDEQLPQRLSDGMKQMESEFPETPSLIYDGPFSEHLKQQSPKMLENRDSVSQAEGRKIAADFLGTAEGRVYPNGACEGTMPAWYYSARVQDNEFTLAVSKQGGEVIGFVGSREPGGGDLSTEQCVENARRFLERRGFSDVAESYYIRQGNVVTVNFAFEQDGVICYPDLIKVGVAADTGGVCSYEARGYLNCHHERELPEPAVSEEQALEMVAPELEVTGSRLALIPTNTDEKLCYEFVCRTEDEREYIVYVNAVSGEQEKVLILLEDENGSLTV